MSSQLAFDHKLQDALNDPLNHFSFERNTKVLDGYCNIQSPEEMEKNELIMGHFSRTN